MTEYHPTSNQQCNGSFCWSSGQWEWSGSLDVQGPNLPSLKSVPLKHKRGTVSCARSAKNSLEQFEKTCTKTSTSAFCFDPHACVKESSNPAFPADWVPVVHCRCLAPVGPIIIKMLMTMVVTRLFTLATRVRLYNYLNGTNSNLRRLSEDQKVTWTSVEELPGRCSLCLDWTQNWTISCPKEFNNAKFGTPN